MMAEIAAVVGSVYIVVFIITMETTKEDAQRRAIPRWKYLVDGLLWPLAAIDALAEGTRRGIRWFREPVGGRKPELWSLDQKRRAGGLY